MSTKDRALAEIDASGVAARQRWRHWKGALYVIVAAGIDEATLEPVVTYVGHDGIVWTRKLAVFLQDAEPGKPRYVREPEEAEGDDEMWVPSGEGRPRRGRYL
jgi:hypothetical protein